MADDTVVGLIDPGDRYERFQDDDDSPEMMPVYMSDLDDETLALIRKGQAADELQRRNAEADKLISDMNQERTEARDAVDAHGNLKWNIVKERDEMAEKARGWHEAYVHLKGVADELADAAEYAMGCHDDSESMNEAMRRMDAALAKYRGAASQ